ncbi:hypothetical protein GpartN1_g4514.t1 [Galdieria partita]|uniref:Uncharacterized protein n=1 Tax=Galdieria partita TaxID=83374 RepID=A0A9C7PXS7_9RHOD|nr:hypothetical protein GpartN1_g4514.t1 [Galdieria partita]
MDYKVVLFREDACLEDNLINLLKDLYVFQEPCRDNIPWLYFVERLERFLELCRSPKEKWYLESLITIFELHHFVNYQHISFAVLEFSRWLSVIDQETALSQDCNETYVCNICRKYLLQVIRALFVRITFYGEHALGSDDGNSLVSLSRDEFYSYTVSAFLSSEPLLALSIWCDYRALYQHETTTSWDTFLQTVSQTREGIDDVIENKKCGIDCWKAVWMKPSLQWVEEYKPCIVSFIIEIHRSGRLGKVLKATDPKTGACYWICCLNWLYTVAFIMPQKDTRQNVHSIDHKIGLWIKEFCWNLQQICAPDALFVQYDKQ